MRAREIQEESPRKSADAFTMTELLLILASVAILTVILLPMLMRSRARGSRVSCANNLNQVGLSFRCWAIDSNDRFPMQVPVTEGGTMELVGSGLIYPHFQVMSNELSTPKILVCPWDRSRIGATNFTSGFGDKNIGYFLDLDTVPGDSAGLLCGDRNLTNKPTAGGRFVTVTKGATIGWTKEIHSKKGNLCFGDASVSVVTNGGPLTIVKLPEGVTNRLAIP